MTPKRHPPLPMTINDYQGHPKTIRDIQRLSGLPMTTDNNQELSTTLNDSLTTLPRLINIENPLGQTSFFHLCQFICQIWTKFKFKLMQLPFWSHF